MCDILLSEKRTNASAEQEGFFNLLFSHLYTSYDLKSKELSAHTAHLVGSIIDIPGEHTQTKYRM